ncbi:MAG: LamG domain-containing protein [Hyphomicrobiaceae bacterium]|nr:MAG: LamG domain-containing protein [Hyphomicrobiaceae bacterium]
MFASAAATAIPMAPGLQETEITSPVDGRYPSQAHQTPLGSFARVSKTGPLNSLNSFTLMATVWSTTPGKGQQGVIGRIDAAGKKGLALAIDGRGAVAMAGGESIATDVALKARVWTHVWASYDAGKRLLTVGQAPVRDITKAVVVETTLEASPALGGEGDLLIGALAGDAPHSHFNGKIEAPRIFDRALSDSEIATAASGGEVTGRLAFWDFAWEIMSQRIVDQGPHGMHGRLVNCPTRAMMGSKWTGREMCWRHAPEQYAAIHFHDDDLSDCGWPTAFKLKIPDGLKSGLYAIRTRCGTLEDRMPFFVLPPKGKKTSDVCVLMSTFTYVVYANFARPTWVDPEFKRAWHERQQELASFPYNPGDHREYSLSTYNFHSDGSGFAFSSGLRPIMNLRPDFMTFPEKGKRGSGMRHLPADTHLLAWLEAKGYSYDVITDHDLHEEGVDLIKPYRVVMTSSHPEYHTPETMDALEAYRDGGGRLCYMGGNGFYWKVAVSKDAPGVIEIRRGEGGIRAWAAEPGEYYNAFDGEYGGLWRRNGRPPQKLVGVGFTAQGDFDGSYYKVLPEAKNPRVAWAMRGISDEKIGDFGLSGGGAAGFELDRAEKRLGTPEHAIVIASSEGHRPEVPWVLVPEEMLTHITTWAGDKPEKLIRADMTFFETPNGGAVFSTGSITFCGSLPSNKFENNISTLVTNVLDRFLDPAPFEMPEQS